MSEWRLMNTRIEEISLTQLCERNNFNKDGTEPYIYKLDGFSGNTISKTDWVRIKVDDNTANKWGGSNWNTSAPNEDVASLPTHTTYWVYGTEIKYVYANTFTELTTENAGQDMTIAAGKTYTVNSNLTYTGTMTIESGGTLIISNDITLTIDGTINNDGIIRNDHTINNNGTIDNTGIINNYSVIDNSNTINNNGTINSVEQTIGGTFSDSGTFNVIPTLTNYINQIANGETYAVTSDVTINNGLVIKNGGTLIIAGNGTLIIAGNGTLTIPNNIVLESEELGIIVNYGTINNNQGFANSGFFFNNGTIVNDNEFVNANLFNNNGLFTNNGTFTTIEGLFNNNGIIKNNETLQLGNISFNTGTVNNYSGTIILGGDGFLFSVQPKQNIGGSIRNEDSSDVFVFFYPFQIFSSDITEIVLDEENITESIYIVDSNVTVTNLDLYEGTKLIINSGVTLTITGTINNGSFIINNGIIINSGTFNNGSFIINNGIIINSGTFINFEGDEPILYNFGTIKNDNTIKNNNKIINYTDDSRIDNNGTINTIDGGITGDESITGNAIKYGMFDDVMNFIESTPLTNSIDQINDGETYIVNNDVTVANLTINPGGKLTISAGNKLKVNAVFTNSGDIINNGTIESSKINNASGTIENNGTIDNTDTMTNNGTITNTGTINTIAGGITGDESITGNGQLRYGTFDRYGNFIQIFTVTSTNFRFLIDGAQQPAITLTRGQTYNFDVSDASNGGHPFRFSTTSNGTHGGGEEYDDDGVVYADSEGTIGAVTTFTVPNNAPSTLYYYCSANSVVGGSITITSA